MKCFQLNMIRSRYNNEWSSCYWLLGLSTGCRREENNHSMSTTCFKFIINQLLTENMQEKQIGGIVLILVMCGFLAFNIDSDNYECTLLQSRDMIDFVPSTNELKKLKFLSPGPKNSTYGPVKSVTRHTIKVERFSPDANHVDDPKGMLLWILEWSGYLFDHRSNCQSWFKQCTNPNFTFTSDET